MASDIKTCLQRYNAAKSNRDVVKASECFAGVFHDLHLGDSERIESESNSLFLVIHQMKDEIRLLMNELKAQFSKLKSPSSQTYAKHPNPMRHVRCDVPQDLSNLNTMQLDDIQSTEALFYQRLFESIPEDIKKSILDTSIESCDNPLDKCRLMMLAMTIFNDTAPLYGSELLKTLTQLSDSTSSSKEDDEAAEACHKNPLRLEKMSQHANNSLILDAIPLVLNTASISDLDIKADSLIERTLNFYSSQCLEAMAREYEYHELHEGLKKDIVMRILETGRSVCPEDMVEARLNETLDLLSDKYIETITDETARNKLMGLRSMVLEDASTMKFEDIKSKIDSLGLDLEIPDHILVGSNEYDLSVETTKPPPKGRGRPKKVYQPSVIVSADGSVRKQLISKSWEAKTVFLLLVQYFFKKSATYLKQNKTRVLLNFANPLATFMESELTKGASQRTPRSKSGSNKTIPTKKLKVCKLQIDEIEPIVNPEISPLNKSKLSKLMDIKMTAALIEAQKCLEFLESNFYNITKLWRKFCSEHIEKELIWFWRIRVDCAIISNEHNSALEILDKMTSAHLQKVVPSSVHRKTIDKLEPQSSVLELRVLIQKVSCLLQLHEISSLGCLTDLLRGLKSSQLLTQDDGYRCGNIIDEHVVILNSSEQKRLGFLFFDLLSVMRYCVNLLTDFIKKFLTGSQIPNDLALGHAIALCQFDWPRECETYDTCLYWIRSIKPQSTTPQSLSFDTKFTYPEFTRCIRNPFVIEDFMALLALNYTLDLKADEETQKLVLSENSSGRNSNERLGSNGRGTSGGSSSRSAKAITTRGVNKTFREDLKIALMSQMKASTTLIPLDLMQNFCINLIENFLRPRFSTR